MAGDRYTVHVTIGPRHVRRYIVRDRGEYFAGAWSFTKARRIADDLNDGDARRRFARQVRDELAATRVEVHATRTARMRVGR